MMTMSLPDQFNGESIFSQLAEEFSVADDKKIQAKVGAEVTETARKVRYKLITDNPFAAAMAEVESAEKQLELGHFALTDTRDDLRKFQQFDKQAQVVGKRELKIWQREIDDMAQREQKNQTAPKWTQKLSDKFVKKLPTDKKTMRQRLLRDWRKSVEQRHAQWELETIAEIRNELLRKLREWLQLLQQMADLLRALSLEPGLLFDLSKDNLSIDDIAQIKRWAEYIAQDEGVKKLCDMLGRLRRAEKSHRLTRAKHMEKLDEYIPDIHSNEEIVGLRLGGSIEYAVPQEKALLADEETALLFDLKFVEQRLLCFDMAGLQKRTTTHEKSKMSRRQEAQAGPIIICVDTSGSMQGAPETVAKAVTLFMAGRAASQNRECLLINFSTRIETMEMSGHVGIANVIQFLQRSFHGGTDATPALEYAIKMMQKKQYQKADLLMLSDFMMQDFSAEMRAQISQAKKSKNRFYSLCIGAHSLQQKSQRVFDDEWVYNPSSSSINQLYSGLRKPHQRD